MKLSSKDEKTEAVRNLETAINDDAHHSNKQTRRRLVKAKYRLSLVA